jgi:hypothetical protein
MPLLLVRSDTASTEFAAAKNRAAPALAAAHALDRERERQRIESEAQLKAFSILGRCDIGETIYHREVVNASSSSGNVLADAIWASQTRAQYVIEYEAVIEAFVGKKVKATVNDYRVKQISKGGYVDASEMRSRMASIADKLVGKTQFYDRTRCAK